MASGISADDFFAQLKTLYKNHQMEEYYALLFNEARIVMNMLLNRTVFAFYSPEDKEDAKQEALEYLLSKMDGFMQDPRNDPASVEKDRFSIGQKRAWLHKTLYLGLLHPRDKIRRANYIPSVRQEDKDENARFIPIASLDRPLTEDNENTLRDYIPSGEMAHEDVLLLREQVETACTALLSLPNSVEVLTAVAYVILTETLGGHRYSLAEYAEILNDRPVRDVIHEMEQLLLSYSLSPRVLLPLMKRVDDEQNKRNKGERHIQGIMPKTLANRKNSILTQLRKNFQQEEES